MHPRVSFFLLLLCALLLTALLYSASPPHPGRRLSTSTLSVPVVVTGCMTALGNVCGLVRICLKGCPDGCGKVCGLLVCCYMVNFLTVGVFGVGWLCCYCCGKQGKEGSKQARKGTEVNTPTEVQIVILGVRTD